MGESRIMLTLNRRHFIRLHQATPDRGGIIVCTYDPDFEALAGRIHSELSVLGLDRPVGPNQPASVDPPSEPFHPSHAVRLQNGVQQHVAAGGGVLRRCVLDLVMTDAVLAGDENHRRRAHVCHVFGVVTGAADYVHVR